MAIMLRAATVTCTSRGWRKRTKPILQRLRLPERVTPAFPPSAAINLAARGEAGAVVIGMSWPRIVGNGSRLRSLPARKQLVQSCAVWGRLIKMLIAKKELYTKWPATKKLTRFRDAPTRKTYPPEWGERSGSWLRQ